MAVDVGPASEVRMEPAGPKGALPSGGACELTGSSLPGCRRAGLAWLSLPSYT